MHYLNFLVDSTGFLFTFALDTMPEIESRSRFALLLCVLTRIASVYYLDTFVPIRRDEDTVIFPLIGKSINLVRMSVLFTILVWTIACLVKLLQRGQRHCFLLKNRVSYVVGSNQ